MNESDVLKKWDLIDKANYSINILNKNINDITLVNNGLMTSLSQDSITGDLGDSVKEHLQSLVDLNSSFIDLLAMDKADYVRIIDELNRLITDPDDNNLYGEEILHYKSMYAELARQCYSDADEIDRKRSSGNLSKEESDRLGSSSQLREEGDYYEQLSEKYFHKEVLFDSVVYNTTGLFSRNDELRGIIQKGYDALPKEWRFDNSCVPARIPEVNAGWKNQLDSIKDAYTQQRYKDTLYRTSPSGSMVFINWDEVDKLFHSNANTVNAYQYAAMVDLLTCMSDTDIGTMFKHAGTIDDDGVITLSETLRRSIGYYENYTLASLEPYEYINNNNIIRATALRNAYDYINSIEQASGGYSVTFTSERFASSGAKEVYNIEISISPYLRTDNNDLGMMFGDMWLAKSNCVNITVGCYATGLHFMMGVTDRTAAYVDRLGGDWTTFTVEHAIGLIPGESLPAAITAGSLVYDTAKQHDARSDADAVLSLQELSLLFGTVSAGGNLVTYDRNAWEILENDTVTVDNVHINEAELNRRIGIYNTSKDIVRPITLEGVERSFYRAITGASDISLLNDDKSPLVDDDLVLFYRHFRANEAAYMNNNEVNNYE